MSSTDNTPKYKGSGRFESLVGGAMTEGMVAGLIAGTVAEIGSRVTGMTSQRSITALAFATVATAAVGMIHGGYRGWTNVGKAKEQLTATHTELAETKQNLEEQKSFVAALTAQREHSAAQGPSKA